MVIAVRAQREALALIPRGPGQQLELIERTLQLAVDPHSAVLRQAVRVVAVGTMQAGGFGLGVGKKNNSY